MNMNKYLFVFAVLFLLTSSNVFAEKEIIISDDKLYSISNLTKKINSAFDDEDYEKVDFYLNKIISKYPEKKELISSYKKNYKKLHLTLIRESKNIL